MSDLQDYRQQPARTGHLTRWDCLEDGFDAGVLRQTDGSLLACLWYRGPDLHSAPAAALITQAARLNALWRRFGGRWCVMTEARRREANTYPQFHWPDPVTRLMDQQRRARFTRPGEHFATENFATLVWKPLPVLIPGWKHLLYSNLPQDTGDEAQLQQFEDEVQRATKLLADCCPTVDGESGVKRLLGSALLTYLHSTVNWKHHPVAVPSPPWMLDTTLATTDLYRRWRPPSLWRWPQLGEQWIRCVGVKAYPQDGHPGMLDALETLPLEYRATIRDVFLDRDKAIQELRKYRRAHYGQRQTTGTAMMGKMTGDQSPLLEEAALDREREASAAQADVEHNRVNYGFLTQTVVVWDADFAVATEKAKQVEQTLNSAGFTAKIETVNTMQAWEGSLPGNLYANLRRPPLSSHNLAHLMPATAPERGRAWNPHLNVPALLLTTGRGRIPFWLDTYVGDVGMFQVVGPIGMGKSTLLASMAAAWRKRGNVFALDKGGSLRCLTYAVGGHWYNMDAELRQVFQAGATLEDVGFTSSQVAFTPKPGTFQCFEMEGLLKTPQLAAATFESIYRHLLTTLDGTPTLLLLDEGYIYLRHAAWFVQDALKDLRKKNAAVGFCAQSIGDYAASPISHDIREQCMTRIWLSNYGAIEDETGKLYEGFSLNERQRQIIAHLIPKRQYYYQGYGQQGNQVFDLGLSPMELAFVGRSRPEDHQKMDEIYHGDGMAFAIDWLHAEGLHVDADALKSEGMI